jgi:hypothetical protein
MATGSCGFAAAAAQASLVIAMIIPISTNTTIAACIQIQVGDIRFDSVAAAVRRGRARSCRDMPATPFTIVWGCAGASGLRLSPSRLRSAA